MSGNNRTVTLNGAKLNVQFINSFVPTSGSQDVFRIIDSTGTGSNVAGTFKSADGNTNLTNGSQFVVGATTFLIEYNPAGSPGDVILVEQNNDAPTISVNNLSYTEDQNGGNPVQIHSAATANDADGDADWDGGKLEVRITANNEAGDEISIATVGGIAVSGANVQDGGVTFGTIVETSGAVNDGVVTNGDLLAVNFTAAATGGRVQKLVRAISYRATSDSPSTLARTVTFTVTDTNNGVGTDTSAISVTATNDAPVFAGVDATPTHVHRGAFVDLDANASASDPELDAADNFDGAKLIFARNGGANPGDEFGFDAMSTLTVSGTDIKSGANAVATFTNTGGTLTITFTDANGTDPTGSRVDEVLQAVQYRNVENTPPATALIGYTFDDGAGSNNLATASVLVTIAGTTSVVLSSGNLTVTDIDGPTDTADRLVIKRMGSNLRISDPTNALSAGAGSTQVNPNTVDVVLANITGTFTVNTLAGDDKVLIDFSGGDIGVDIVVNGGVGNDAVGVIGDGSDDTAAYTPDASTPGNGVIVVDVAAGAGADRTITFAGLEPVDVSGFLSVTLAPPGANDLITVANGFDDATGAVPALIVSGTCGGVAFQQAHLFNNTTIVITTTATDGVDTINITTADNAHANTNLTINTGSGADTVNINGNVTLPSGGNLTVTSGQTISVGTNALLNLSGAGAASFTAGRDIAFGSGAGITTVTGGITLIANVVGSATGTFVGIDLNDATLTSNGGAIALDGTGGTTGAGNHGVHLRNGAILDANGSSTLTVTGDASVDGAGVLIQDDATDLSVVNGLMDINGLSSAASTGATDPAGRGVQIEDADLSSTGSGNIDVSGRTSGSNEVDGIFINDPNNAVTITTGAGTILLNGVGGGTGDGIQINDGNVVESTGAGTITLTGQGGAGSVEDVNLAGTVGNAAGTDTITFVANEVGIGGSALIDGQGALVFDPRTNGTSIGLGGGAGTLNLDDTELGRLSDGFSSITIGDASAGDITLDTTTFQDNLTLLTGGDIISSAGTDITNSGNTTTLNGDVEPGGAAATQFGQFEIDGSVTFASAASLDVLLQTNATPGTTFDQVRVIGAARTTTLAGATLNLTRHSGFAAAPNDTFVIVDNVDSGSSLSGTFTGLADNDTIQVGADFFRINSNAGTDSNDVVLTYLSSIQVNFENPGSTTAEGNGAAHTLNVILSTTVALTSPVVVDITDDGTGNAAGSGTDYTLTTTQVTFPIGSVDNDTQAVTVTQVNDQRLEGDETVDLSLSINSGVAATGSQNTHTVTIDDNETGSINMQADQSNAESVDPTASATLTIMANGTGTVGLDVALTVSATDTGSGSATSGVDFAAFGTQVLTFNTGDGSTITSTDASLDVTDDNRLEGDQTVEIQIAGLSNDLNGQVSVTDFSHVFTIEDNEVGVINFQANQSNAESVDPTVNASLTITAIGTGTVGLDVGFTVDAGDVGGRFRHDRHRLRRVWDSDADVQQRRWRVDQFGHGHAGCHRRPAAGRRRDGGPEHRQPVEQLGWTGLNSGRHAHRHDRGQRKRRGEFPG
ncbi:MAG: hypothetical protein O3A00_04110 [Planctomycetota bacterium]|nr:hypothetical protein [Planctomycetota bacterium]